MRMQINAVLRSPGRRLVAVGAFVAVVVVIAVGLLSLTRGSSPATTAPSNSSVAEPEASRSVPPATPRDDRPLSSVASTSDPETFARSVARTLFTWDTTTGSSDMILERLAAVADPTGYETPGLLSDIQLHVPPDEVWVRLREYETRQWIEIDEASVPAQWVEAVAEAPADAVLPGTTAVSITGELNRAGVWDGVQVASTRDVGLTVFVACTPSFDPCRLLRLSAPGKVLE
jgi:hypothetical protein